MKARQCGRSWCFDVNPFEYMQALAELWGRGGKEFAAAQQGMLFDVAERMAKVPQGGRAAAQADLFDPQGLSKANEAFAKLWSAALELSQAVTRNMQQGDDTGPLVTDTLGQNPDPLVPEMRGKVFAAHAWFAGSGGMDEALQRMAEGPRLADMWDTE